MDGYPSPIDACPSLMDGDPSPIDGGPGPTLWVPRPTRCRPTPHVWGAGGSVHQHYEEEQCYGDGLYFYHLGCHQWVSAPTLSPGSGEPHKWGVGPISGRVGGDPEMGVGPIGWMWGGP